MLFYIIIDVYKIINYNWKLIYCFKKELDMKIIGIILRGYEY